MAKQNKKIKKDVINKFTAEAWAYTKEVKEHFFKPKNLLLEDPQKAKYDAEGIVGSPACILQDTKIHTNFKTIPISNLNIGDKVLSHNNKYNKITKIFCPSYTGSLVELNTRLGNIIATNDHLIYGMEIQRPPSFFMSTKNKLKNAMVGWRHAGDFKKGDMCLYPINRTIKTFKYLDIKSDKIKFDYSSKTLPKIIKIDKDFLELAGYFIAEGYTKTNKSDVGFVFADDEDKYALRVQKIIKKIFGLETFIRKRSENHRIDVTTHNIHLNRLFSELFGKSASEKHIPEFMMLLPPTLQKYIILGFWRGDGYINIKRNWPRAGYVTISPKLIQQIKFLLLRQNIIPSMYEEEEKIVKNVYHKKSYRIHIGDNDSFIKLAKILKIKFTPQKRQVNQQVWCDIKYAYIPITKIGHKKFNGRLSNLEVENAHSYVTNAFLAHNCGDVMRVWLKIDAKKDKIKEFKWRTFGCASAIASTSMLSVMVTEKNGMKIDKALQIKPQDIMKRLGGLPDRKIHCSVLGDKALRAALNDWFRKTKQLSRIVVDGKQILDPNTKTTEADIEEAVLEGATTLLAVQKRTKVGIGYPECIPKVEELIRFYREKYFGLDK